MKKLVMTLTIILGLSMTTFADPNGGGLFQRGETRNSVREDGPAMPPLPGHDETGNQDASPLGSGTVLLLGLGAAYLVGKKRNEK